MNELGVYKFTYEKRINGELTTWKVCIGAYNVDDAQEALFRAVGVVKIMERGFECRLDHLSDKLRDKIVENAVPKKRGPGRPKKR